MFYVIDVIMFTAFLLLGTRYFKIKLFVYFVALVGKLNTITFRCERRDTTTTTAKYNTIINNK